ncbi:MAG: hypothetical protein KDB80_07460 [Planctomycetes bacterium]|nr:hypothetical protein [Planctomycetota bacterium]
MHPCSWLAWFALGGVLSAQGVVRPKPFDPRERGIEGRGPAGQVEVLAWGDQRIVLSRPVRAWEIAELGDGRWVILAGGVDPGLDIYLFDPRSGEVIGLPFHVSDGLRLPPTFASGLGSWPLFELPSLFVLAVERRGRIRCLAVDASRQVPRELASLDLPMTVRDLRVSHDPETEQVRVEFDGADAVLEFVHPLAPRLLAEPRYVDLGDVPPGARVQRTIVVRNGGRRPLRVGASATAGLELVGGGSLQIEPGEARELSLTVDVPASGSVRGSVRLDSPVVGASVSIAVRGSVVATAIPDGTKPPDPSTRSAGPDRRPTELQAGDGSARSNTLPVLGAELARSIELRRLDRGRISAEGLAAFWRDLEVASGRGGADSLVLRNDDTGQVRSVARSEPQLVLDAIVGDSLSVALARDGLMSAFLPLAVIRPSLRIERGTCAVRTAPNRSFLLCSVAIDERRRPVEVLAAVRGVADATGDARIAVSSIAVGSGPAHFVVAESARSPDRLAWSDVVTLAE